MTAINPSSWHKYGRSEMNTALAELYSQFQPMVYGFLRHRGVSHDEAEDLVQETFLAAALQYHQLESPKRVLSWLLAVARNKRNARLRHMGREEAAGTAHDLESASVEPFDDVLEELAIDDMVRQLPRELHEVLTLRAEGYTARQIAMQMGLPSGAVHDNLRWLRWQLYQLINPAVLRQMEITTPQPSRPPAPNPDAATQIDQVVAMMPARRREVFTRQLYRGLKPRQIAKELGISANCVRVHLNHAYTDLARRLDLPRDELIHMLRPQPSSGSRLNGTAA